MLHSIVCIAYVFSQPFVQEVGYRVNLRTRECEKFEISEKFDPVEVPVNATLDATGYLGAKVVPENNVEMNFYSGHTEEGITIVCSNCYSIYFCQDIIKVLGQ